MKKTLSIVLTLILLASSVLMLTGCENGKIEEGVTDGGVNLKFDFSHINNNIYNVHFDLSSDQEVTDFDEDSPEYASIENSKENYVIDLNVDEQSKETLESNKETVKEDYEVKEEKFGKYEGYYYKSSDDEISAEIYLDTKEDDANIYVSVNLYLSDSSNEEKNDIESIFNSSDVQKLLKSVSLKTTTSNNNEE